jgi:hypothetical protein
MSGVAGGGDEVAGMTMADKLQAYGYRLPNVRDLDKTAGAYHPDSRI